MRKIAKIWLTFVLGLTIETLTAYGYYYHDPYEDVRCSECPNFAKNKPDPEAECRACCNAKCKTHQELENCLNQCKDLPDN